MHLSSFSTDGGQIKEENLDASAGKMRERLWKAMDSFPVMVKAKAARENVAKEIDATYAALRDWANKWSHEMAKRSMGTEYTDKIARGERLPYHVCSDEYNKRTNKALPKNPTKEKLPKVRESVHNILDVMNRSDGSDRSYDDSPVADTLHRACTNFNRYKGNDEGAGKMFYSGEDDTLLIELDGVSYTLKIPVHNIVAEIERQKSIFAPSEETRKEDDSGEKATRDVEMADGDSGEQNGEGDADAGGDELI